MSGIHRLLSRRDKNTHGGRRQEEKVIHSLAPKPLPNSDSSSVSSFMSSSTFSCPPTTYRRVSSSSLSSLSLAFAPQTPKRSPSLQPTEGTIHASTANAFEDFLLQPKQTAGFLHGLFPEEDIKPPVKSDEKKIKVLSQRLSRAGITNFKEPDINYVLNAGYAKGDSEKAYDLLVLLEESEQGIIRRYDPSVKLLGAVNRDGLSCYLDSVLFAMFARLSSFEAILYNNFEDEPRKRLAALLRLWVNTLRIGKLITVDITKHIQLRLADCGWKEAATPTQQNASEAFSFITETLALPLLTLKMDIYHVGKEDESDDHKFVNERLLEVAVPDEPIDGRIITLEECLETYFNNRIEVRRYLERRNTATSIQSRWSVDSNKEHVSHIEIVGDKESRPSTPLATAIASEAGIKPQRRPSYLRQRAPSIVKEYFVSEKSDVVECAFPIEEEDGHLSRKRAGSLRREILMPAFQFFSLIPWYTDTKPSNDAQVAAHFSSARPMLGICLKRYSMGANGQAIRLSTRVDIPLEIALPHFIQDDAMSRNGPAFGNFKLSLQSAVCHRGNSVNSGHYVSLVRSQDPTADESNNSSTAIVTNDSPEMQWLRLDDIAKERVAFVDAEKFLRHETPYLLFYQVLPIDGDPENSNSSWKSLESEGLPTYAESLRRDFGVPDPSSSFQNANGMSENVVQSEKAVKEATASQDYHFTPFTNNNNDLQNTGQSQTPTSKAHSSDSGYLSAPPEDLKFNNNQQNSRGRTIRKSLERPRMSRSLSRFAGRFVKEKSDDGPAVNPGNAPRDGNHTTPQPSQREPAAIENTKSSNEQQGRSQKESKQRNRLSHHSGGVVSGAHQHQYPFKGKHRGEKPERECKLM